MTHRINIIRRLMICPQITGVLEDPHDTCSVLLEALDAVYRNQIVPESKLHYLHPHLVSQSIYDVVEASLLERNPHLADIMQISVQRDAEEDYVMDVYVFMKPVQQHLQSVNEGIGLVH